MSWENTRVKLLEYLVLSSRIESALVCVHRKSQYNDLKLPESPRFVLITVVMGAVSTFKPTDCLESSLSFSSQKLQSHKIFSTRQRAREKTPTFILALGANPEGKETVKGIASQIQCSRIGAALMCVHRNEQHCELCLTRKLCSFLMSWLACSQMDPLVA